MMKSTVIKTTDFIFWLILNFDENHSLIHKIY